MAEISYSQLDGVVTSGKAAITDVKHLSSYNWIEAATPTIVVPGSPARWDAPEAPQQITKDSGLTYIAQNAARHPDSPLEPLFRSLYAENDSVDISSANIISDRNNIRKLLSFVSPELNEYKPEAFTINIEVMQNTAILCRDEAATQEFIGPHDFRGYGHEFEKAYTVNQVSGSTGHHRIISYQFCDLHFILRHETDAFVGEINGSCCRDSEGSSVSRMMKNLAISPRQTTGYTSIPGSKLKIIKGGQVVPLRSTLEIKTRATKKHLHFRSVAPQLWVSQTPNLVRAYHDKGKFDRPQVENVAAQIQEWEAANQLGLRKLAWLIKRITTIAKECGGKAKVKYDVQANKLVISQDYGRKMLPADLYCKWNTRAPCTESNLPVTAQGAADVATQVNETGVKCNDKSTDFNSSESAIANSALPFSDVIRCGLDKGFREVFRSMPTKLSDYLILCNSLKLLAIDVLQGQHIRELMADMRLGKVEWDPEERQQIGGLKRLARDAAFKLLYVFLQSECRDVNMAYNAALFVVSHRRIFRYRTRKMVREAFLYRFTASQKQQKELDKWPIEDNEFAGSADDDKTTSEEDIYFNSDSSF